MFKLKMVEKPELLNLKTNVEFPPVYVQTDHSKLENLDYKNSGHIGFASSNDLEKKVDKIEGKGLSTNDYTNDEKNKLAELENYTLPIASNTKLGGIKIGENLTITEDGILSATGGGSVSSMYYLNYQNVIILSNLKTGDIIIGGAGYVKFFDDDSATTTIVLKSDFVYMVTSKNFNPDYTLYVRLFCVGQNSYSYTYDWNTIQEISIWQLNGRIITDGTSKYYKMNEMLNIRDNKSVSGILTFTTLPKSSVNPTDNNHFTRKGYVDSLPTTYAGYDATKTQVLKNINGVLTWQDE